MAGRPTLLARLFSLPRRQWQYFDWPLFLMLLLTTAYGLAVLWGTTHRVERLEYLTGRQAMWWAVGLVVLCGALALDPAVLRRLAWPTYLLAIGLLVYVLVVGARTKGAASWVRLPGGVRLQPAELAKIATVLVLARFLAPLDLAAMRLGPLARLMAKVAVIAGAPFLLIAKQPDLGSAAVFVPVVLTMLYAAGLRVRYIAAGVAIIAVLGVAAYPLLKPYQKKRLLVLIDPEKDARGAGYNIIQAKIALGSGGLWGKGWGEGTQTSLGFLPEHQSDFIFNSLGEQLGLAGCLALLAAYLFLFGRGMRLALLARQHFGAYAAIGLLAIFASHVALNVLIAVQLLPVTGLPLPLLSAGGSFLVGIYFVFGTVLSIGMRRHHFG